jgi:cytochrome P450
MTYIHLNSENYVDASEFRGFRFLPDDRDKPQELLVSTSDTYLTFGQGRHTW